MWIKHSLTLRKFNRLPGANLFVITWKPLLYQPWCSRIFNQIYMGSHWLCCQNVLRPWCRVTPLLSKLPTSLFRGVNSILSYDVISKSAVMQYFECMVRKTFYSCFLFLCYPGSRKVLTSAKITISGQKCCCHLMQGSLKYLCSQPI